MVWSGPDDDNDLSSPDLAPNRCTSRIHHSHDPNHSPDVAGLASEKDTSQEAAVSPSQATTIRGVRGLCLSEFDHVRIHLAPNPSQDRTGLIRSPLGFQICR